MKKRQINEIQSKLDSFSSFIVCRFSLSNIKYKPFGKKGQFYMIAALVLISLFIAISTVNNTFFTKDNGSIDGLINELKIEKGQTLDYISFHGLTGNEANDIFSNFSKSYLKKIGEDKNSVFIFGNSTSVTILLNKTISTNINYSTGDVDSEILVSETYTEIVDSKIKITIDDSEHEFEFYEGQNIYYLIDYSYNEERYILYG